MYNIGFTLGDPSGDGHANTSEYHIECNYSVDDIREAYKEAVESLGFDYVKEVCSEYEDSELPEEYAEILIDKGILEKDSWYSDNGEYDGYMYEEVYIEIFFEIIKYIIPDLIWNYRDLEEQTLTTLYGAAYGIAYHGE